MSDFSILLTDDCAADRRLLAHVLRRDHPELDLVLACDRDSCLEAARLQRFQCLVVDYNLPPYEAPQLIGDLATLQPGVPVLVISSSETQEVVIQALRHGVSDFLTKQEAAEAGVLWCHIERAIRRARERRSERRRMNRRMRSLRKQAETDALTGLNNRRYAERIIRENATRADRRRLSTTVMLDVDHFKSINDTFGHGVGDRVLREVAEVLRTQASAADIVTRWGGEEFVVFRQSNALADSWMWADDIRRAIQQRVALPDGTRTVTASLGVEVSPVGSLTLEAITRADHAMYLAKYSGRNRVCSWPMVCAIDTAQDLQSDSELSVRDRLIGVIGRMGPMLGPVQSYHVGPHGRVVHEVAMRCGRLLFDDVAALEHLALASEFHDIGKLGIPESLLGSPRRLDHNERRFVGMHARFGGEICRACASPEEVARAVEHHHDRFDVALDGVLRLATPTICDVVSASDALVAMLTQRRYAERMSIDAAMQELERHSGGQFHPLVVEAMRSLDVSEMEAALLRVHEHALSDTPARPSATNVSIVIPDGAEARMITRSRA